MWRGTFNRSEHECRNFNSARNLLRHGDCNCNMRITQIGVKHKWRQYDKEDWEDWSAIFFILSFFFLFFCSLTTCFGNNVWANLCCRHRLLLHILVWIHSATYNYRTLQRDGLLDTLELRLRKSEKHKNGKLLTVTLKALFEDSETEAKCFLLLCEYNWVG